MNSIELHESEECILEVISTFRLRSIYLWGLSEHLIQSLFMLNISVLITSQIPHIQHTILQTVAVRGNQEELRRFSYLNGSYNPLSLIALLDGTEKEGKELIYMFWSLKLYNIIVIVNGILLKSVHIGCGHHQILKLLRCSHYLTNNYQNNLQKCGIGIIWIPKQPLFIGSPNDGMEYILLKLILKEIGVDIAWHKEEHYGQRVNSSWTGALGNLEDVAAGGFMMTASRLDDFFMTYPHLYDHYIWFTAIPDTTQAWLGLDIFQYSGYVLLMIFMCCCFSIFSENEPMFSTPSLCFINVFRVALGQPIRKTPKRLPARVLFISWVLYQMVLNNIISGMIVNSLTSKKKVETPTHHLERRNCLTPDIDAKGISSLSFDHCDLLEISRRLVRYKNFSVLVVENQMKFIANRHYFPIKSFGKAFIQQYVTFILPKHSHYFDQINRLVFLSFESGLIEKIKSDVYRRFFNGSATEVKTVQDRTLLFVVFAIGYTISTLVFLIEFHKRKLSNIFA